MKGKGGQKNKNGHNWKSLKWVKDKRKMNEEKRKKWS